MDIVTLIETYPEQCEIIAWGCMVIFFAYWLVFSGLEILWYASRNNRDASRCLGFHSGQISGYCHNKSCPYFKQCHHWGPAPSIKERLYRFGRRVKARFSR